MGLPFVDRWIEKLVLRGGDGGRGRWRWCGSWGDASFEKQHDAGTNKNHDSDITNREGKSGVHGEFLSEVRRCGSAVAERL